MFETQPIVEYLAIRADTHPVAGIGVTPTAGIYSATFLTRAEELQRGSAVFYGASHFKCEATICCKTHGCQRGN